MKGLGFEGSAISDWYLDGNEVSGSGTTSVFPWEYVSTTLWRSMQTANGPTESPTEYPTMDPFEALDEPAEPSNFTWRVPDPSPGSDWYNERGRNLVAASATFEDAALAVAQGLEILERQNPTALWLLIVPLSLFPYCWRL